MCIPYTHGTSCACPSLSWPGCQVQNWVMVAGGQLPIRIPSRTTPAMGMHGEPCDTVGVVSVFLSYFAPYEYLPPSCQSTVGVVSVKFWDFSVTLARRRAGYSSHIQRTSADISYILARAGRAILAIQDDMILF